MKLYDVIKKMLIDYPSLRDSDRKLIWNVWNKKGLLDGTGRNTSISFENFLIAPHPESIRRCRQKIQEQFPELASSKDIKDSKKGIEAWGGNHVFREDL